MFILFIYLDEINIQLFNRIHQIESMKTTILIIKPFASKTGSSLFLMFVIAGVLVFAGALIITTLINDYSMLLIFGGLSAVLLGAGEMFYILLPRVKIAFDSTTRIATVKSSKEPTQQIPFDQLQPFQIYEVIRGYAHQYYCRNASFGKYSDLFFSARHTATLKRAKQLQKFTGVDLIDYDGRVVSND